MSDDLIREPYSTAERVVSIRMCAALERIAAALERTADADPLTMLNDAMKDEWDADGSLRNQALALGQAVEPKAPFASNGYTLLYKHPDPSWQIVARRDATAESGYVVSVEEAG